MTPPPWSFDNITDDLILAYTKILKLISGWGVLSDSTPAVYSSLGLPQPQEPFPAAYVYLAGQSTDSLQGTGKYIDVSTVHVRIIGGPVTPRYKFDAEHKVYLMVTPVKNVLRYYRYLEDPVSKLPFPDIYPQNKLTLLPVGSIRAFDYGEQGKFIGIEIPSTIGVLLNVGRNS